MEDSCATGLECGQNHQCLVRLSDMNMLSGTEFGPLDVSFSALLGYIRATNRLTHHDLADVAQIDFVRGYGFSWGQPPGSLGMSTVQRGPQLSM